MKKWNIFLVLFLALAICCVAAGSVYSDSLFLFATGIPVGTLYSLNEYRGLGEIAISHPNQYKRTLSADGEIRFGLAVARGSEPGQGKLLNSTSDVFLGVAAQSIEARKFDESTYIDEDVLGVWDTGIPSVYVEEAVNEHSPVRIRHTAGASPREIVGGFCTAPDPGKTTLITGARFMGRTTGAGKVALQLFGVYTQTPDTIPDTTT